MTKELLHNQLEQAYYNLSGVHTLTAPDSAADERFARIAEGIPDLYRELCPERYLANLAQYLFAKSMECSCSYALYDSTDRPLAKITFIGYDEIYDFHYRTNLPLHIEKALETASEKAKDFIMEATQLLAEADTDELLAFGIRLLMLLGYDYALTEKLPAKRLLTYDNTEMLTPNEVRNIGLRTLIAQMDQNGLTVQHYDPSPASAFHAVLEKDGYTMFLMADAQVHPEEPYFITRELEQLSALARERGAFPYRAFISVGANNKKHFNSGVLLTSDQAKVRIVNFAELIPEGQLD